MVETVRDREKQREGKGKERNQNKRQSKKIQIGLLNIIYRKKQELVHDSMTTNRWDSG